MVKLYRFKPQFDRIEDDMKRRLPKTDVFDEKRHFFSVEIEKTCFLDRHRVQSDLVCHTLRELREIIILQFDNVFLRVGTFGPTAFI